MFRSRSRSGDAPASRAVATCATPATAADDAVLVAAARGGDPRAFVPLYERYLGPVYRYCYVRLGSREAAEDATSEVFLKALAALPTYHDGAFAAWLFRIAHNVVIDAHRRRRPTAPLASAGDPADPDRTPEELAVAGDEAVALRAALAALPAEQRAAVELRLAGWSGEQIAQALDRSPAAVKQLRFRALGQLRRLLTHHGEHPTRSEGDRR